MVNMYQRLNVQIYHKMSRFVSNRRLNGVMQREDARNLDLWEAL